MGAILRCRVQNPLADNLYVTLGSRFAIAAAALFSLTGCLTTSPDELVNARQHEADALYDAGLYSEAARLYEFVAERRPQRKHAHVRGAHCYQMLHRPMIAIQMFEHVRDDIDSRDLFVLHNLAGLYMVEQFLPEAADAFRAILEINPHDVHAKLGLREAIDQMSRALARATPLPPPPTDGESPEPPKPPPGPEETGASPEELIVEADRLVMEASLHARRLATQTLPQDRPSLTALRMIATDARRLLDSAVLKYREAHRAHAMEAVQSKIQMADQVLAFVDQVLGEIDARLGP